MAFSEGREAGAPARRTRVGCNRTNAGDEAHDPRPLRYLQMKTSHFGFLPFHPPRLPTKQAENWFRFLIFTLRRMDPRSVVQIRPRSHPHRLLREPLPALSVALPAAAAIRGDS